VNDEVFTKDLDERGAPGSTAVGQRPADEDGSVVRRRELGALLRTLRTGAGMTIEQVTGRLQWSPSKASRMEIGFLSVTLGDIRDLCDLYQVTDPAQRDYLTELAGEGRRQDWWQSYDVPFGTFIGLEADAASIGKYHATIVPGLLQTEDYARAIIESGAPAPSSELIEQRIAVRLARQRLLSRDDPPKLHVIMDESALRRIIGRPSVMKAQLDHIVDQTDQPNVVVQVIPYDAGMYPALDSSFTILGFPASTPGVVYVEGLFGFIFVERPHEIERYQRVFKNLESVAANKHDSITIIKKASIDLTKASNDLTGKKLAGSAPGLERLDELLGHEQQDRSGRVVLLDRDRPAGQAGTPRAGGAGRERRAAGQHVPERQHDAEVGALNVGRVVKPVVRRAHDHPAERAEGPAEIGVLEGAGTYVDRDQHGRDRTRRHQGHDRDGRQDKPGRVHERVRAK
jgi:transcriptional regulator with XRE-family HTH domain